MAETRRRFRVGLSFPGERRDYVRMVAESLVPALGRENILYDEYLAANAALKIVVRWVSGERVRKG